MFGLKDSVYRSPQIRCGEDSSELLALLQDNVAELIPYLQGCLLNTRKQQWQIETDRFELPRCALRLSSIYGERRKLLLDAGHSLVGIG
jgi:hypothetical protein